jgi:hypothetical protein
METALSGSVAFTTLTEEDIDESLEFLMSDSQFEQDLINSFNDKMYIIKASAPNPLWTLCSITMRMIRILPQTQVIPIDEFTFHHVGDSELVEFLAGANLIKIQKKYVQRGEWH